MTRSEALAALIAKIEAGTAQGRVGINDFWAIFPDEGANRAYNAYYGSLDAAVAFVKAVLPEWVIYRLNYWPDSEAPSQVEIWETGHERGLPGQWHDGSKHRRAEATAATPARALLLAALRALAAQEAKA